MNVEKTITVGLYVWRQGTTNSVIN